MEGQLQDAAGQRLRQAAPSSFGGLTSNRLLPVESSWGGVGGGGGGGEGCSRANLWKTQDAIYILAQRRINGWPTGHG